MAKIASSQFPNPLRNQTAIHLALEFSNEKLYERWLAFLRWMNPIWRFSLLHLSRWDQKCPEMQVIRCTQISISVTKCPFALLPNFNNHSFLRVQSITDRKCPLHFPNPSEVKVNSWIYPNLEVLVTLQGSKLRPIQSRFFPFGTKISVEVANCDLFSPSLFRNKRVSSCHFAAVFAK